MIAEIYKDETGVAEAFPVSSYRVGDGEIELQRRVGEDYEYDGDMTRVRNQYRTVSFSLHSFYVEIFVAKDHVRCFGSSEIYRKYLERISE